jgi:hypothetical protein
MKRHVEEVRFDSPVPRLVMVFEYEAEPVFLWPPDSDFLTLLDWLEHAHPEWFALICHAAERIVAERED